MLLELHTISRDNLFDAQATYNDGKVTVHKGSRINLKSGKGFNPSDMIKRYLSDSTLVGENGILLRDETFESLSTAATFVAGRVSNGMITWKTPDNRYVRYTLKADK